MVCLSRANPISPEAQEIITSRAYHHEGLRRLAATLPADDAELQRWLVAAIEKSDGTAFQMLISAAAMDRRNLPAELLPAVMTAQMSPYNMGWLAWHMQGDVTQALLASLDAVEIVKSESQAMALFIATAWWQEHHRGEPVPKAIERWMDLLAKEERGFDVRTKILLRDTDILLERPARSRQRGLNKRDLTPVQERREPAMIMKLLTGPFEKFIYAREVKEYRGSKPKRRAVEDIGRNEKCPCGSGKKYKKCCEEGDRKRLSRSSSVAGVTKDELISDPTTELTVAHFDAMNTSDMLTLQPDRVPQELRLRYVLGLTMLKAYEKAIEALRKFGVPQHLESVWSHMFAYASGSWRPDIARQLMELLPDAEEKFGVKTHAGIRALLVGDDPALLLGEIERSAEALLKARDLQELTCLSSVLLGSPYRGLGVLIARGLLPIAPEEEVPEMFDTILDARAKLDLPLEDEFSDWMDERTLREARQHETAEAQEAADKLEAAMEEMRALKEERAKSNREARLREQQERRAEQTNTTRSAVEEEQARERERTLRADKDRLSALLKEKNEEKLRDRHLAQTKSREEKQKAAAAPKETAQENEDEDYKVEGHQPLRLIQFPEEFMETLKGYPKHVGRATLTRLGRLAAGEPSAFDRMKQLKAYPGVLRARVADKHRLLFCLEPGFVRVVDLIRRADLDRRIERLQVAGLPSIG